MPATRLLDLKASDGPTRRALTHLSVAVAKSKKIIVVTGAGISCPSGIPDFRSTDGLYALVKQKYPEVVLKGRDLFDASLFRDPTSTSAFYTFVSELKRVIDDASPSVTHHFIKTLDSKHRLLRSYTQNIDGLEERAGLLSSSSQDAQSVGKGKLKGKEVRNVQLHGDIHRVRCTICAAEYPCTEEYLCIFYEGVPPDCPDCMERSKARVARSARALKVGTLRPAIVLYDEVHPLGDDIGIIQTMDINKKPDMLVIMGTSLKVHGLKKLVKDFAKATHASSSSFCSSPKNEKQFAGKVVFVNKTPPGSEWDGIIDYHVSGDTDAWAEKVVEDWKKLKPSDWEIQKTLVTSGDESSFKVVKDVEGVKVKGYKKKSKENVPPVQDVEVVTMSVGPPTTEPQSRTPPSSPTKRRQSSSHYSDVDCSPSKRRGVNAAISKMSLEERSMLFDTTNSPMKVDEETAPRKGKRVKEAAWTSSPMKIDGNERGRRRLVGEDSVMESSTKVDKGVSSRGAVQKKEVFVKLPALRGGRTRRRQNDTDLFS